MCARYRHTEEAKRRMGAATRKYPWEQWFALGQITLLYGIHYRCSQSTMCQSVRNAACARGLSVRLTDTGTEITVEVMGAVHHPNTTPVAS
jgi:hypothetical protein